MIIALLSIIVLFLFFTAVGFLLHRRWRLRFCAPCAAVATTWGWLYIAHLLGSAVDLRVLAILMGGSVVGLMYMLQRVFQERSYPGWWWIRMVLLLSGFFAVDALLSHAWISLIETLIAGFSVIAGGLLLTALSHGRAAASPAMHALKHHLRDCC